MRRSWMPWVLAAIVGVGTAPILAAEGATTFERIGGHYETIRQALLHDTTDPVSEAAGAIVAELDGLREGAGHVDAGTRSGTEGDLTTLLPEIREAAVDLQAASDLERARAAFGPLSKALVRYRRLVEDPKPVVVFCSMAQEVWLQPKGEIGNPYYGQSMARCGDVVSE